ncbi:MAG: hypothetical protein KDE53_04615, partial [Caldilineaceae bacterium]|nr:hypothetical protein [Caldilineaceae bacterium]
MIKVKAIKPTNRGGTKPRSSPVTLTELDPANIAFCTLLEWRSTGRDFQQFHRLAEGDTVAAPSVRLLFIYLIHPNDSANLAYDYNPVNLLPVTEEIDDALAQIQDALGITLYKCKLTYESLIPTGFATKGLMIDNKRYKPDQAVGDCWINLLSVTEVLPSSQTSQTIVIANQHPQPVPPLEYRLSFPYDPDFAKRYADATSHALVDFPHS